MKSLLISSMGILCLIFSFHISAQAQEKGKLTVNLSIDINASAAEVWNILGKQFAEIEKWSSAITSSEEVPYHQVPSHIVAMSNSLVAGRKTKCKTRDVTEIIVEYSDAKKTFTFVTAEPPSFLVYGINYTQVNALSAKQSRVTFDIELQLKGLSRIFKSVFKKKITKSMIQLQQDLKQYIEAN